MRAAADSAARRHCGMDHHTQRYSVSRPIVLSERAKYAIPPLAARPAARCASHGMRSLRERTPLSAVTAVACHRILHGDPASP